MRGNCSETTTITTGNRQLVAALSTEATTTTTTTYNNNQQQQQQITVINKQLRTTVNRIESPIYCRLLPNDVIRHIVFIIHIYSQDRVGITINREREKRGCTVLFLF